MAIQPLQLVGHRVVVVGGRPHPGRGPLEEQQLADDRGDLGHELHGAGAGADHRHALPGQIDVVIPPGRVERRALEGAEAGDRRRQVGPVELAHRTDDGVGHDHLRVAVGPERTVSVHRSSSSDQTASVTSVPKRIRSTTSKASAQSREVGLQHRLGGVVERPVVALGERVAVVVVRVVDPAARVAGSRTRCRRRRRSSRTPCSRRRPGCRRWAASQAGHAGADHRHRERHAGSELVLVPRRGATVLAPVAQLLLQQREVLAHLGPAHGELHDSEHLLVGRHRRRPAAAVAEGDERVEGETADPLGLVVGEPTAGEGEEHRVGPQLLP